MDNARQCPAEQEADPPARDKVAPFPEPLKPDAVPKRDLKSIIARAIAAARSWNELAAALAENNVMLAAKGGGLVVKNASTSEEISKISALGLKYVDLIRRFGEGFPEHHATWLVEKALNDNYIPKSPKRTAKARNRKKKSGGDDDFSLIED